MVFQLERFKSMVVTLHTEIPTKPKSIAFDCYKTLFYNTEESWIKFFEEIIHKQKIPLNSENFWKKSTPELELDASEDFLKSF